MPSPNCRASQLPRIRPGTPRHPPPRAGRVRVCDRVAKAPRESLCPPPASRGLSLMAIRVAESVVAAPSREEAGGLPDGGNGADHRRLPAMDAPVVIEVTDLTKRFGAGVVAVDDLSRSEERGQVVGLLGPNGAGKTTTLRALLGLIRPTSGTMAIFGETIRPGIAVLSRVGVLVEGPRFVPHL